MSRILRPYPPIWLRLVAGILFALSVIAFTALALIRNPPQPPPQTSYLGRGAANPWGGK